MSFVERPMNFALEVLAALIECALKKKMLIPTNPKTHLTEQVTVAVEAE